MSTRSTTHFVSHLYTEKPTAIIYRHSDGYPSGAGADILRFFDEVAKATKDTRFSDPSYLAAKYVVFLANKMAYDYKYVDGVLTRVENERLDFLSVGVTNADPFDIEYRYTILCNRMNDRPEVFVDALDGNGMRPLADVLAEVVV